MKTKIKYIILLLLVIQTGYAQEASKFTVKVPNKTFIGAILEPGSINSDTHQFLDVPLNPITISYSLPMKSQEITPVSYTHLDVYKRQCYGYSCHSPADKERYCIPL